MVEKQEAIAHKGGGLRAFGRAVVRNTKATLAKVRTDKKRIALIRWFEVRTFGFG